MAGIPCSINYGTNLIAYEVFFVSRKTLEIAVHPNKAVTVKAPIGATMSEVEERIRKRARWIKRQIRYFSQFDPRTPQRIYVGGESHLYLGKSYRLKLLQSVSNSVALKGGYFEISTLEGNSHKIEGLLDQWYREKALLHFGKTFDVCWKNLHLTDYPKPSLKVQKMEKRWGSLSKQGTLTLNIDLIRAPRECIEYVIIHELCHLVHFHHGADFYNLLSKKLPDWIKLKHKLEISVV